MKKFKKFLPVIVVIFVLIIVASFVYEVSIENYCENKVQKLIKANPQTNWQVLVDPPASINKQALTIKKIPLVLSEQIKCEDQFPF